MLDIHVNFMSKFDGFFNVLIHNQDESYKESSGAIGSVSEAV